MRQGGSYIKEKGKKPRLVARTGPATAPPPAPKEAPPTKANAAKKKGS